MSKKTRSPFLGKPRTRRTTDLRGNPVILVTPDELTPLRAKVADFLAGVSAMGLLAHLVSGLSAVPALSATELGLAIGAPLALYPVIRGVYRWFFTKQTRVMFTPTLFRVKRGLFWVNFDRQLEHKFEMIPHDKTEVEREQHEYAARKAQLQGRAIKKRRYYGQSYHISFEYMGQRNDVLSVYGVQAARRIKERFELCDKVINLELSTAQGAPLKPEDQWDTTTGDIPD